MDGRYQKIRKNVDFCVNEYLVWMKFSILIKYVDFIFGVIFNKSAVFYA